MSNLRAAVKGRVIAPEDAGYDAARAVFYGGIDRRPAAIVRAADDEDVSRVVAIARETGRELAVRGGGHSTAGHGTTEGGIVLDLAEMRALEIDAGRGFAWAQAGLTTGEYASKTDAYGLATGFGDTGSVGIGGLTLGGGIGLLVRKHGLTIDSLVAADMATADGRRIRVDAETHPDLFWAIRGGGGNFGVATRFQFRLHKLDSIVGGMLMLAATADAIASFVAEAQAAPDDLSTIANIMPAPPMPFIPPEHHGKLVIMATVVYAGAAQDGERAVAPLRSIAKPIADMIRTMRYPEIFPPEQPGFHPVAKARTMFLDAIDRRTAETIVDRLQASTAPMRVAQVRALGGAAGRVPAGATAYAHRERRFMVNVAALYERPADAPAHEAWVVDFASALRPNDGAYVNFLGDEGEARVREAYPGTTWGRLREIKRRYDPTNLFRLNQNIPPAD
jgi:FAD/FMN-containing dehydrogenase